MLPDDSKEIGDAVGSNWYEDNGTNVNTVATLVTALLRHRSRAAYLEGLCEGHQAVIGLLKEQLHGGKTAARYEQLRKLIDGGSESMTHDDAVEELRRFLRCEEDLEAAVEAGAKVLDENGQVSTGDARADFRRRAGIAAS